MQVDVCVCTAKDRKREKESVILMCVVTNPCVFVYTAYEIGRKKPV